MKSETYLTVDSVERREAPARFGCKIGQVIKPDVAVEHSISDLYLLHRPKYKS